MRIQRGQVIAGHEAVEVRDALRHVDTSGFSAEWLASHIVGADPHVLIRALEEEGYVCILERESRDGVLWRTTVTGQALAMAKLGKPYRRQTADKAVEKLLTAAREINSDPDLMYWVDRLELIGSYVDGAAEVGDVDVIAHLTGRWDPNNPTQHRQWQQRRVAASGRRLATVIDQVLWPLTEVQQKLRVSPMISLLDPDGVPAEWRRLLIFERRVD